LHFAGEYTSYSFMSYIYRHLVTRLSSQLQKRLFRFGMDQLAALALAWHFVLLVRTAS
jgi:hypothetical protein